MASTRVTTPMTGPLVKIGTENDAEPPLIIERPDRFLFEPGERAEYREATDEEYQRYVDHYNRYYDLTGGDDDPWHPNN